MKTVWSLFRDKINSTKVGMKISRSELIYCFLDNVFLIKARGNSVNTLDNYRNMAEKCGYLSKTNKRGVYEIEKRFSPTMTSVVLRQEYELENIFI